MAVSKTEPSLLRNLMRTTKWIALAVALALTQSTDAMGQVSPSQGDLDSPGLTIEAAAGFDGLADRTAPIPLSFLIRNDSERNIEGRLTIFDPMSKHELNLGDFVIAPGTTRRVTSIQATSQWYDCIASFRHGELVLWRRGLNMSTGRSFETHINYVFSIETDGRRLQLPGALNDTNVATTKNVDVAGKVGRPIRCLAVKPWQLPNHPAPLLDARAMVFAQGASELDLNRLQWKAVAEWMCEGGTIFVHAESREIFSRLTELAPLSSDVSVASGPFRVRRFGLGALYEYQQPLHSADGIGIQHSIAKVIRALDSNQINSYADNPWGHLIHIIHQAKPGPSNTVVGRAERNAQYVISFFGLYTLFSGLITLLLFRMSQKWIGIYTAVVVLGASVLAASLGGYLRFSKGDLRWITVTQAGIGGLVQTGTIEVQSAGNRNTRVSLQAERPDLQLLSPDTFFHYYGSGVRSGYSPFTWQQNLAVGEENSCQIHAPTMIWGRRRCHATAFKRDQPRIDFELNFVPNGTVETNVAGSQDLMNLPQGLLRLKLVNRLPFALNECWLVVGTTCGTTAQPKSVATGPQGNNIQSSRASARAKNSFIRSSEPIDGMIDVYHIQLLSNLPSGETLEQETSARFTLMNPNLGSSQSQTWPPGSRIPPTISHVGAASAWIIGIVEKSPIMEIDEQRTDFIPMSEKHFFIQEILPEDLSDTLRFSKATTDLEPADAMAPEQGAETK